MKCLLKIKRYINKIFKCFSDKDFGILNRIFIKIYILIFKIKMDEYETLDKYKSFNDFFYRKFKYSNARTINFDKNTIISPSDGVITQVGDIGNSKDFLIKGSVCSLKDLLGHNKLLYNLFKNEKYIIIYLSPQNYHRFHMSYDSYIKYMFYIPGNLDTVNPKNYPNNFKNYKNIIYNERVLCLFKSTINIFILKIFVGSIIIGGIETKWHGLVNNNLGYDRTKSWKYNNKDDNLFFKKGDEIGKFRIGSCVIIFFSKSNKLSFCENIKEENEIFMGQDLIKINN